jgi:hypothetical protein
MDRINLWFVRASLVYFLVGTFLGLLIAAHPGFTAQFRAAHVHLNLAGFMTMMIFGVGYHIFPRFTGRSRVPSGCSLRLVTATFWLGNAGVLGLTLGFILDIPGVLTLFAVVTFLAVAAFVANLLCTFAGPAPAGMGCGAAPAQLMSINPRPPMGR